MRTWSIAVLAALVVAACLVAAWRQGGEQAPPVADPESPPPVAPVRRTSVEGYAGSQACRECHAELFDSYQGHSMARALFPAGQAPVVESDEAAAEFTTEAGRAYRVARREGILHHEESAADEEGLIYQQGFPIAYVLGSGKRGRSYLVERDGYLTVSPIAWYSQRGRFDLSPGYQPGEHQRFEREATDRCLVCHSGGLQPAVLNGNEALRREPPWFLEHGIGCERCHGPAEQHVRRHQGSGGPDQMPRLNELTPSRRDAVCAQCHLQGGYQVLRRGRWHTDFRPGEHLSETWLTFVAGDGVNQQGTLAVSQFEQMYESRCYAASQGALGCASCHDPHRAAPEGEPQRADYYRQRCFACHGDDSACAESTPRRATVADDCTACHLPSLSASDVPHTTQTDHRILKTPESASQTSPAGWRLFLLGEDEQPPEEATRRARGLLQALEAESRGRTASLEDTILVLTELVRRDPLDAEALDALAMCHAIQGDRQQAVQLWERLTAIYPQRGQALQALAELRLEQGRLPEASAATRALLEIFPHQARWSRLHSRLEAARGNFDLAWQSAEQALLRDPGERDYYDWAAVLARGRGDLQGARDLQRKSLRIKGLRLEKAGQPPR